MKRRQFITRTGIITVGAILAPQVLTSCKKEIAKAKEAFSKSVLSLSKGEFTDLRGGVRYFNNAGGTVGLIESKDGFTIIDTQSVDGIRPLIDSISKVDGKDILYVCNTHHHGDHTGGNGAFDSIKEGMVAQSKCPEYQKLRAEEQGKEADQKYADILFDNEYTIDLGEEKIKCYHFGNGHTADDVLYHMESANVVHMGDLMFNNIIPVFRVKDGSDAHGWIARLDKAITLFDDDTQFIFGHGVDAANSSGSKENLKNMRGFIADTATWVEQQIKNGKTLEELKATHASFPGHEDRVSFWDEHFNECLTGFYENLSA